MANVRNGSFLAPTIRSRMSGIWRRSKVSYSRISPVRREHYRTKSGRRSAAPGREPKGIRSTMWRGAKTSFRHHPDIAQMQRQQAFAGCVSIPR